MAAFLWAALLFANTPTGGVKGRVLSKTDRYPLEHARVRLMTGAELLEEVRTDVKGAFIFQEVPDGDYTLVFLATGYLENRLPVTVADGRVKNVFNIVLSEINKAGDSWEDVPYGSSDIQRNIKGYLRLRNASDVGEAHLMDEEIVLAGVRMDEVNPTASGYLVEALRDNKFVSGAAVSETAFGGFNGDGKPFQHRLLRRPFHRYGPVWPQGRCRLRLGRAARRLVAGGQCGGLRLE